MFHAFEFLSLVVLVALLVKFIRTLGTKWGIIEYLQAHAPNEFFYKLMGCEFCQSFWLGLAICTMLWLVTGTWWIVLIPFFSCNIR